MLTQRFGSDLQTDAEFVESFLHAVERHPGCCDEVWLASHYGFPPIEAHRRMAEALASVAEKLRAAGLRVSLQISNTIGHGQYMCARDNSGLVYPGSPAEHMVGPDGTVADYCFCWNGEHFRGYVEAEMREYARLRPHCAWVDDDIRASNHAPVDFGCFCDGCIAKFNARYGAAFDRQTLVEAINYGGGSWRQRWVAFVRGGIAELAELIAATICERSPETYMGLQYCAHGGYTGYGYEYLFDAMRRGSGKNPKSRPGGGAYDDHNPNAQIQKAFLLSWQNSMLPDYVTEIRPEIENLPFYVYGKTPAGTCYETSLYLASGANAMSYSMLMGMEEPMAYHERFFAAFAKHRHYWEALAAANDGTTANGLCLCLSESMWERRLARDERPFAWNGEPYLCGTELARTAIPLTYGINRQKNPVYLLHYHAAEGLSDGDIAYLLTQPVLTDGRSLDVLARRGYADCFSARAVPLNTQRFYEKVLPHRVNESLNAERFGGGFTKNENFLLVDTGGSEPLTCYQTGSVDAEPLDRDGAYPFGIASAVVATAKGARWAVFGKEPWNANISFARRNQLLRAAEEIAGGPRFAAILESRQQAVLLPREDAAMRTTSVSVLNCTVGVSEPLRLRIRRPAGERFAFETAEGRIEGLPFERDGSDYLVTAPEIMPWTVGTLWIGAAEERAR